MRYATRYRSRATTQIHYVEMWHVRLRSANNVYPLSWGAQTEKIQIDIMAWYRPFQYFKLVLKPDDVTKLQVTYLDWAQLLKGNRVEIYCLDLL